MTKTRETKQNRDKNNSGKQMSKKMSCVTMNRVQMYVFFLIVQIFIKKNEITFYFIPCTLYFFCNFASDLAKCLSRGAHDVVG